MKKVCKYCKKVFIGRKRRKFCTIKCYWDWETGKPLSKERIEKIKERTQGENNSFYGKKHTKESRLLMRKARLGKKLSKKTKRKISKALSGKNAYNWKGGISKDINEYAKQRRKNSPQIRLSGTISSQIRNSLKNKGGRHWETLVGYTLQDLMEHLENLFDEYMNWQNQGSYWHIDHIKPQSLFSFSCAEDKEFKECWSLANLQPLKAKENLIKYNKYEVQESF